MTTKLKNITQTVCIILLLMLFPGTAHLQEQDENPAPPESIAPQAEAMVPAPESVAVKTSPAIPEYVVVESEPAGPDTEAVESEPTEPKTEAVESEPIEPKTETVESEPTEPITETVESEPIEPKTETVESEPTEPITETVESEPALVVETAATIPSPAAEKGTPYDIKKGDTLWDISNTFLKDPFLWPFIWKANPYINNPDLIFAGNKLVIPSLSPIEQALIAEPAPIKPVEAVVEEPAIVAAPVASPEPAAAEEEEIPSEKTPRFIRPGERVYPIIDKYAMLSMGFVDVDKSDDRIVGSPEKGKTLFGYDDIVYITMNDAESINIGDKYLIFTPLHKVKHPKTRKYFGKLIRGLGILQITAKDASADVLTARITLSFDLIEKGNMLTPYEEPVPIYQSAQAKAKDISGYILEVTDKRSINAQTDVVYLDKGISEGVEPGDRFVVYENPVKRGFPRKVIGEVQVLIVKEHTSTAIVQKSSEAMERGNAIDFKR